jgi:hypothetical protein
MDRAFDRSRRRRVLLILVFLLCLAPVASYAQEAVILGRVTDDTGAILPGVTVTATSPALQVPQVLGTTDERGEYRLGSLPIGTYAVVYALEGFETVRRQELRLTIGFQAKVDIVMKVGALSESVTVTGEAPVVDVTSTTSRTQLTRETLELRHRQPILQGVRRARRTVGGARRRGDQRAENGYPGRQSL